MKDLVSVIIPVYNVEQYLPQCIDSIINQTYTNLEIILVDDGSPDNCPAICDEYAAKDSRIRVIHKKNGGLSDARNAGLDIVTGAYITFVDSDDSVAADYVQALYTMCAEGADISIVGMQMVFEGDEDKANNPAEACCCVFSQKEAVYDQLCRRYITVAACAKMYAADIFRDIRYPVGELYEDLAVIYPLLLKADRIAYTDRPLYRYFIRKGSIMQQGFDERKYAEVRWIERAMALVEEKYPEFDTEIRGRRVWSYFKTLHRILCSKDRNKYRGYQDEMIRKIRRNSQGLLASRKIDRNLKIKIASLYFGRYGYYLVQKISDGIKQIKVGQRYVV